MAAAIKQRTITVKGFRIHTLDAGVGDPPVVLLHGLPTNVFLWRNIIPRVAQATRVVAFDLLGCGQSDKPLQTAYTVPAHAAILAGVLNALKVARPLLVGMDLGLIVALHYALQQPADIRGLVMFEGFFLPTKEMLRRQSLLSRLIMGCLYHRTLAEKVLVQSPTVIRQMLIDGTVRTLTADELQAYTTPLADGALRRNLWLDGIGPYTLQHPTDDPSDVSHCIDRYAAALRHSPLPKLLLYAQPGMTVTEKTVRYARQQLSDLDCRSVGRGKHFLPEDQPEALAEEITAFVERVRDLTPSS